MRTFMSGLAIVGLLVGAASVSFAGQGNSGPQHGKPRNQGTIANHGCHFPGHDGDTRRISPKDCEEAGGTWIRVSEAGWNAHVNP